MLLWPPHSCLKPAVTFLTDFADQAVLLPVALGLAIVLAVLGWRRGALAWIVGVFGTLTVMLALKLLFAACGPAMPLSGIRSPSGHTAAAAVVYGGLAALLGLPAAIALLLLAAAAMLFGASRLTLGIHTLPEVAIGAAVGCVGAALIVRLAGPRPPRMRNTALLAVLLATMVLFHGVHLHAEPAIGQIGHLLEVWPLSMCRPG